MTENMRILPFASRYPMRLTALFAVTLAAPLACGASHPSVGGGDSMVSESGSAVGGTGGTPAAVGGTTSGSGDTGPMIVLPSGGDGGACGDGCEDKVVCGDGVLQAMGEEC